MLAIWLACTGQASTATFDIEGGADYLKPLDLAVSKDQVYILMQRLASDLSDADQSEEVKELLLEVRSRTDGKGLWRAELNPELFGDYDSFGSMQRVKVAHHRDRLTILIPVPEKNVSFLLQVGAKGRFGGKRTFAGEGSFGLELHRHDDGVAVVFPQGVQWLNDELETLAEWSTSNVLMTASGQGNVLWVVEGEPLSGPLDFHAGLLRSLAVDGGEVKDELVSPLPRVFPMVRPTILAWPDEVVVLIPDVPLWQHCAFRTGMAEAACKGAIWRYASPGHFPRRLPSAVRV